MLNRCYGLVMCLTFLGAILSQVYFPFSDPQVFFLQCASLSIIILADAIHRKTSGKMAFLYFAGALLLAPLVVPRWYANRPLHPGEWRKGGVDANFYRAFAVIALLFTGTSAACNFLSFGSDHGFELIINAGFCVAGTAMILSLATLQERILEKGASRLSKNAESEVE